MNKMNETQIEKLKEIMKQEENDFDFNDYVFNYMKEDDLLEIDGVDELREYFEKINVNSSITNAEVIYYTNAIEFLKENDNSLNKSIEIAVEIGCTLENINSEVLASLLKTSINEDNYKVFVNNVLDRFNYEVNE